MTLRNAIDNHDIDKVRSILDDNDFSSKIMDKMLALAAQNGHTDTVSLLLLHGADIYAANDWALRWAAQYGHTDTVEFLLDRGADIHAKDDWALCHAAKNGHAKTFWYLICRYNILAHGTILYIQQNSRSIFFFLSMHHQTSIQNAEIMPALFTIL